MPILPSRIQDLLDFADQHAGVWSTVAAQIGLTPAQATAFKNAATAARADYNAQLAAEEARRVATNRSQQSVTSLRRVGGDSIRLIKAFAESQSNPDAVYDLAQIPPPATPGVMPPPGRPFDFRAELNTDGSITLRWKAQNPPGSSGTVYNVRRKLANESGFTFIGAVGARRYTDVTLPGGVASAKYVITGQRAESVGQPSSPFTVMFGQGGPGLTITAQFSDESTRRKVA